MLEWPVDLVFVRHGESERNLARKLLAEGALPPGDPRLDALALRHTAAVRLTERGRGQAALAGAWLRKKLEPFDGFVSSPYARALETAALLALPGAAWREEPLFAERDGGVFERDVRNLRDPRFAEEMRRLENEPFFHRPEGGESMRDVCVRARLALRDIAEAFAGKRVVVVCHGECMLAVRAAIERWTHARFKKARPLWNCEIVMYSRRHCGAGSVDGPDLRFVRTVRPTSWPPVVSPWETVSRTPPGNDELFADVSRIKPIF